MGASGLTARTAEMRAGFAQKKKPPEGDFQFDEFFGDGSIKLFGFKKIKKSSLITCQIGYP